MESAVRATAAAVVKLIFGREVTADDKITPQYLDDEDEESRSERSLDSTGFVFRDILQTVKQ